jgi:hypothetical protein
MEAYSVLDVYPSHNVTDPAVAESIAARHGVEFCSELQVTKLVLEEDARATSSTVLAIQKPETTPRSYRSLFHIGLSSMRGEKATT